MSPQRLNGSRLLDLTFLALMVFKELEALERSSSSDQLVRELGLVIISSSLVINLLVSVLGFT